MLLKLILSFSVFDQFDEALPDLPSSSYVHGIELQRDLDTRLECNVYGFESVCSKKQNPIKVLEILKES